jgi:hypothetical protein
MMLVVSKNIMVMFAAQFNPGAAPGEYVESKQKGKKESRTKKISRNY